MDYTSAGPYATAYCLHHYGKCIPSVGRRVGSEWYRERQRYRGEQQTARNTKRRKEEYPESDGKVYFSYREVRKRMVRNLNTDEIPEELVRLKQAATFITWRLNHDCKD